MSAVTDHVRDAYESLKAAREAETDPEHEEILDTQVIVFERYLKACQQVDAERSLDVDDGDETDESDDA
jgi:hypothetical protein